MYIFDIVNQFSYPILKAYESGESLNSELLLAYPNIVLPL